MPDDGCLHVFLSDLQVMQSRVPLRVMLYFSGINPMRPLTQIDHPQQFVHEFIQAYPHTIHRKPATPLL